MRVQLFRDCIGRVNEKWLAEHIGFPRTGIKDAVDLLLETDGIEVKSRRIDAETLQIPCHEHQRVKFQKRYDALHWAFVYYRLNVNGLTVPDNCSNRRQRLNAVREAIAENCSDRTLESYVVERRVVLKPWKWILRYPVAETSTGDYRYVRARDLKMTNTMIFTKKGPIYLPANFPTPVVSKPSIAPNREVYVLRP